MHPGESNWESSPWQGVIRDRGSRPALLISSGRIS